MPTIMVTPANALPTAARAHLARVLTEAVISVTGLDPVKIQGFVNPDPGTPTIDVHAVVHGSEFAWRHAIRLAVGEDYTITIHKYNADYTFKAGNLREDPAADTASTTDTERP